MAENEAYSPAGTQFQECLLNSLRGTDVEVTHVYALRPVASFPRDRRLVYGSRHVHVLGSLPATLLGFINFGPVKTVTSGLALFPRLLWWAWRERRRPRVFLLYNINSPPGLVSVIAGRFTGCKVVPIVADLQVPGHGLLPDTLLRRIEYWLQKQTLPLCSGLVVLTRRMVADFAPAVPYVWMEGALPDRFLANQTRALPRRADRDSRTGCVFMYAGGLSELKGVTLLLDAFALLTGEEYALWITGRGPMDGAVTRAAERDSRITYWGFPDEDELQSLYEAADVLVNPHSGQHESARYLFPSKLIEYLGTGRPVISTCSTPEIADEYGNVVFIPDDETPDAVAETMRTVASLSLREREEVGDRGRKYVVSCKSWAAQGSRIVEFVRTLSGAPSAE